MRENNCEGIKVKQFEEKSVTLEEQMDNEIKTNEVSQVPPSFRRNSPIFIEETQPKSFRKERGIHHDTYSYPEQFFYKVKSKVSKQKPRSRAPMKVHKRQTLGQPENITQLSYQLSVGLSNDNTQGQPFAVYNTQQLGNSPIYIAPSKYQDRKPINEEDLDDYRELTNFVRNTRPPVTPGSLHDSLVPGVPAVTAFHSSQLNTQWPSKDHGYPEDPPTDHGYSQGYDPFFPGFGAKIRLD